MDEVKRRAIQTFYRVARTSHHIIKNTEMLLLFDFSPGWVQCMDWKPHTCWVQWTGSFSWKHAAFCQTESAPWGRFDFFWQILFHANTDSINPPVLHLTGVSWYHEKWWFGWSEFIICRYLYQSGQEISIRKSFL